MQAATIWGFNKSAMKPALVTRRVNMVEQVHMHNETVGVRVAGSRNFSDFKVRRGYTVDNDKE